MAQKISNPDRSGTQLLIRDAFANASTRRITLHSQYLDDEKLSEQERVVVLHEVFQRNLREKQLARLARYLSPALGGDLPPNLLVYGPSGTGKSVTCLHFLSALADLCADQHVAFDYTLLDLTTPRTCFGALNSLASSLDPSVRRYRKGIALEHMQENIISSLNEKTGMFCILVDEVDNITSEADLLLTFLAKTLPKRVPAGLFYIFLTNRLEWEKNVDPRILSVLKKQDLIFEPYDAADLLEILNLRVKKALDESKVEISAVRKIAAYASREAGDARKAVELLAKSVKVAEETSGRLTEQEVDSAEHSLEVDKTRELIGSLAAQQKMALQACYFGLKKYQGRISTGTAYDLYRSLCVDDHVRPLSQRRFSDMVSFLDIYGLINARVTSKGRYGKTRELSPSLAREIVQELLTNH